MAETARDRHRLLANTWHAQAAIALLREWAVHVGGISRSLNPLGCRKLDQLSSLIAVQAKALYVRKVTPTRTPQLVPEQGTPEAHLAAARRVQHPDSCQPRVEPTYEWAARWLLRLGVTL